MSPLLQKQQLLIKLLASLLAFVSTHPTWAMTLGEGRVRKECGGHMARSLHYEGLAQDLNLFVDGVYITDAHPAWDAIGAFWLGLHPLARWGGTFTSRDYNHLSIEHEGRA